MKFFEDDMDELFNKAGRQYPLKTDAKDWESVRAALHAEEPPPAASPSKKYRRLLPLLLLLMIPAVYVFLDKENLKVNDGRNNEESFSKDEVTVTPPANTNTGINKTKTSNQQPSTGNVSLKQGDTNLKQRDASVKEDDLNLKQSNPNVKKDDLSLKQVDRNLKQGNVSLNHVNTKPVTKSTMINVLNQPTGEDTEPGDAAAWTTIPSTAAGYSLDQPSDRISLKNKTRTLDQPNGLTSVPKSDKRPSNRKGLYYGIIAAPDLSTIKSQAVKKMGYSAGIIAGYNVNAHWAVEAGMLWSNKKYYTDGKFFDKKGPGIPDYVNVKWLDGGCNMFEFPVVVRYNLSTKRNTFYANVGVTSYMMHKEDYTYGATAGVNGNYYEGYKSYNRSGDHLFANMQFGAGYMFGISPKLNVRVEPYLKAPLKKIGIGKMPITSTGLYFSITRDIR